MANMTAAMHPPPPSQPFQPTPAQYPTASDISSSPSASTHNTSQQSIPTYASINQPHPASGPSHFPPPQQNSWYGPNYYQPQPNFHQPHHRPYQNQRNQHRYQENYPPQYGQQGYQNGPYYPPPQYGQMGGPGPATMQNGYGGFSGEYPPPPHVRGYPPQNGFQQPQPFQPNGGPPPRESSGHESGRSDPGTVPTDDTNTQQPPPPAFPPQDMYQNPPYASLPNGQPQPPPPGQHQPYQPYYPPNHPYTYGGGFGYQQYSQPPYRYNAYDAVPPQMNGGPPNGQSHPAGKGLNPAAQGFNFVPTSTFTPKSPPHVNGDSDPPPTAPSEITPIFASIQLEPPAAPLVNGHSGPQIPTPFSLPVIVDGEKLKGLGGRRVSGESDDGGLGLSQMIVLEAPPSVPEELSTSTSTAPPSEIRSTPAMTPPTTVTSPTSVQTPRAPTPEHTTAVSPKAAAAAPVSEPDGQWNFVGPTVSGYTSPQSGPAIRSFAQAMPVPSATIVPKKAVKSFSTETGPLKLRSSRPDADSPAENAYSSLLSGRIPHSVQTEQVGGEVRQKSSMRGKGKASGKKVVFKTGESVVVPGQGAMLFGSAIDEVRPQDDEVSPPHQNLSTETPAADGEEMTAIEAVPVPITETPKAAPKPTVKPSSWAALLKTPTPTRPSAPPSDAPSSRRPSPAKSTISLPQSEAGPSRLPTSPIPEPTTPKSTATPLPPVSTGASVAGKAPRPVFNYAAAAAAGASLTPQEELAKLLMEGVRRRGNVPVCLPRGLINTGNMCFANTILQVLVYCPPVSELFEELGKRLKADLARRTPLLEAMIIFLREFTAPSSVSASRTEANGPTTPKGKGRDVKQEPFVPENVYDAMKENKRFDSMRRGFQEDAEEYLGFFLNTLHEELLYLLSRTQTSRVNGQSNQPHTQPNGEDDTRQIIRPVSPGANNDGEGWLEVGKKQKTNVVRNTETRESAVSRIFGGTLRSVLHTPGQKDSITLEPYQPLQLDLTDPTILTVTDALRHISEPEIVPGVYSTTKREKVDATKQVYIDSFPQVLICHLKRFVYEMNEMRVVKKARPVAYGTELVIPPEIISPGRRGTAIKYKLFGVVYHHGTSASGGHYTTSVSRQDTSGWIHFDDELCTPVGVEEVTVSEDEARDGRAGLVGGREKVAYLLFYLRVRS